MQPQRSLWKLLFISFFAFLVVACKPIASFSVSPDPVKAGVEATFDASSTVIYNKPKDNAAKSYTWDFGDGSTGSGKVATHTYAAAGTFKVKLTVVDTAGRSGFTTENLVVASGDVVIEPTTTTLNVVTQIAGGVALTGAEVTVGTATATSNADGLATLDAAPVGEDQVVTVKKDGYVTQSIRATLAASDEPQQLLVLLMPEKDTLSIANIAEAQVIASNYLGASVTVPANAFVNASTGAAATGAATVKLTPWDISSIDLQATPGNGRTLGTSGNFVDLISAGMLTVDFFDAAGNKLQVAPGKSATIQMDLPQGTTSIGGNPIAEGTSIPLWHFDETQGLWIEEGTGYVVATDTGLAVQAIVSHFSTWNWTSVQGNNSTPVSFGCITSGGAPKDCFVTAEIMFADGSKATANLRANSRNSLYVPLNVSIQWTATTVNGLVGTSTSPTGSTSAVTIPVEVPTTSNFVQCRLPDTTTTACSIVASAIQPDGSTIATNRYIPADGAQVSTNLRTVGDLHWTATSQALSNDVWTTYTGDTVSIANGPVDITLLAQVESSGKTILVQCINNFEAAVQRERCGLTVRLIHPNGTFEEVESLDALTQTQRYSLPPSAAQTRVEISGSAFGGQQWSCARTIDLVYGDLTNNQSIVLNITAGCYYT